jgi:chemotaxis protein MotB
MTRRSVPRVSSLRASNDRWLFGYADVVTLLFACFASLYAARLAPAAATPETIARVENPRVAAVLEAAPTVAVPPTQVLPVDPQPALSTELQDRLAAVIGREGAMPGVEVSESNRGLVVSLPEAGSFPAGRAEFSAAGRRVMLDLAATLRDLPNLIRVEGHTDNVPIHTGTFASNWELSTARATRVVQFLIEECGLDPSRLSAAGYAEHRPRLPNDSPEARARNRRVDIVVLDPTAATLEEPAKAGR